MASVLINTDPRSLSPSQYRSVFLDFLLEYEYQQISTLLFMEGVNVKHFTILVSCRDLTHKDPAISFLLLRNPKLLFPIFEEAVQVKLKFQKKYFIMYTSKLGMPEENSSTSFISSISNRN